MEGVRGSSNSFTTITPVRLTEIQILLARAQAGREVGWLGLRREWEGEGEEDR